MANNRLYLVHKPTGNKVLIGKRMGCGWYTNGTIKDKLTCFYDEASESGENQDDFALMIEDSTDSELPEISELK